MYARPFLILSALLVFTGLTLEPSGPREMDLEKHTITVGGKKRTYWLYVPESFSRKSHKSLVVALHGGGGNGRYQAEHYGFTETADTAGFIAAFPDGSGRRNNLLTWNAGTCCAYAANRNVDDVGFLTALIDEVVRTKGVDRRHVFVTGMSNGAMMSYRLAAERPGRVTAVAAVSGTLNVDVSTVKAGIPVMHVHGAEDELVPYEGGPGRRHLTSPYDFTSVDATITTWVRANRASTTPVETHLPDLADDGTTVIRYVYASRTDPHAVVLYKVIGGGHAWPGQPAPRERGGRSSEDISATALAWSFFRAHL